MTLGVRACTGILTTTVLAGVAPAIAQEPPTDPVAPTEPSTTASDPPSATPASEPEELGVDPSARSADKGTFGLGVILGEPTGISAKLYLQDDQAIQAAIGFAFIRAGLHVHADYVLHPIILQTRDSFVLPVYVGPGVRLIQYDGGRDDAYFAIGARAVGGLLFDFKEVPLDAFVEVAGVLELRFRDGDGLGFALNAAAGARYYF